MPIRKNPQQGIPVDLAHENVTPDDLLTIGTPITSMRRTGNLFKYLIHKRKMNAILKIAWLLMLPAFVMAQTEDPKLKSLHRSLDIAANDTVRMNVYLNLAIYYNEINRDSALYYLANGLPIAQKLKLKLYEAQILENRGYMLTNRGNYPKALESFLASLKILEDPESEKNAWNLQNGQTPQKERLTKLGFLHLTMGHLYGRTNTNKQISSYYQSLAIAESIQHSGLVGLVNMNLGNVYTKLNKLDSALLFEQKALAMEEGKYGGGVLNSIGQIYEAKGDYELALDAYQKALKAHLQKNNLSGIARASVSLGSLYLKLNRPDSSLFYGRKALETSKITREYSSLANAYQLISNAYSHLKKADSAYTFLKLSTAIRDSLNNVQRENLLAFQSMGFDEQLRLKKLEEEKIQIQTKVRTYALLSGIAVFMVIAFLLYRNNQNRKKANELLQSQKEEIAEQKDSLEQTLSNLKSTQSQLIQSEKMASLGELTAGIAHEIQNPLNFVNNFSQLNTELVAEVKDSIRLGNLNYAGEILDTLAENEHKILHHGQRADAIVKSMLQHSRSSTGSKEPTNINALAEEYLRLAYHGLRAKDKSFNATLKTSYDNSIGHIEVIKQDIGRMILNLINNAFYAVGEKAASGLPDYKPMVEISTARQGNFVVITVKDNGKGIPEPILQKIFQPFFTTKPTGEGTGLGLSLSYDIVKAHGGEIKVESVEGKGSSFTILLPC